APGADPARRRDRRAATARPERAALPRAARRHLRRDRPGAPHLMLTRRRLEIVLLPLVLGALIVTGWSLAVRWTGTKIFPSPQRVVMGAAELVRRGVLLRYLRDSLLRVASGYGL